MAPPQLPGPEKCANREPREPLHFLLFDPNYPPLAKPSRVSLASSLFPTHLQPPGPDKCANREPREPAHEPATIPPPVPSCEHRGVHLSPGSCQALAFGRRSLPPPSYLPTAVSGPTTMGQGVAALHVRAALHDQYTITHQYHLRGIIRGAPIVRTCVCILLAAPASVRT